MKGIRLSVWKTKDLITGGSNLTSISFANLGSQVKLFDTLKYYQQSPLPIASTITPEEKSSVLKIARQFIWQHCQHDYFREVWQDIYESTREKQLEMIKARKGVIPYEQIATFDSLDFVSENHSFFQIKYTKLWRWETCQTWTICKIFKTRVFCAKFLKVGLERCTKCTVSIREYAIQLVRYFMNESYFMYQR